jgi:hypothetical protein
MVYGELGRYPLALQIKKRMISFWYKTLTENRTIKLSQSVCSILQYDTIIGNNNWLNYIRNILNSCGISYVFNNPETLSLNQLISKVETILKDQYLQKWHADIRSSSKGNYYQYFKQEITFEKYLMLPKYLAYPLIKFRLNNHNFPVETGRWLNIPRDERVCKLCNSPAIADEFHYLFRCPYFRILRKLYLPDKYLTFPNIVTFQKLLCTTKIKEVKNLSRFIRTILETIDNM